MDYEPSPIVKPFTLDQRYVDTVNSQYLQDTRTQLAALDKLKSIMKHGHALSAFDKNHLTSLRVAFQMTSTQVRDFTTLSEKMQS